MVGDRTSQAQLYIFKDSFTKMFWFWKYFASELLSYYLVLTSSASQPCIGHTQDVVSQFLSFDNCMNLGCGSAIPGSK